MTEPATCFENSLPSPVDPLAAVISCLEHGHSALVLDAETLDPTFFDLSTGVLGEVVRKLTNYRVRMAVVAPDLTVYSTPFQQFAAEANRGQVLACLRTREEAREWLTKTSALV